MGKIDQLIVDGPRGKKMYLDMAKTEEQFKSMTVLQLKEKIEDMFPESKVSNLRLIFTYNTLDEDSALLSDYGMEDKSHILTVIKVPGGGGSIVDPVFPAVSDKDGNNRSMEELISL